MKTPVETTLGGKPSLVRSFFLCTVLILTFVYCPLFWQKLRPSTPSLGYLTDNSLPSALLFKTDFVLFVKILNLLTKLQIS